MVGELFDVSTAHKLMKMMIFKNSRFKLGLKIKNAEFAGLNQKKTNLTFSRYRRIRDVSTFDPVVPVDSSSPSSFSSMMYYSFRFSFVSYSFRQLPNSLRLTKKKGRNKVFINTQKKEFSGLLKKTRNNTKRYFRFLITKSFQQVSGI